MDFDASLLAELQSALPAEDLHALLTDYLESTAARMAKVETLAATSNWKDLGFEAHTLVSTSGSYGLSRASALARSLQQACKASDADQAPALVAELVASTNRGCEALRSHYLGERAAVAA